MSRYLAYSEYTLNLSQVPLYTVVLNCLSETHKKKGKLIGVEGDWRE